LDGLLTAMYTCCYFNVYLWLEVASHTVSFVLDIVLSDVHTWS
jgi:hypothetical protein